MLQENESTAGPKSGEEPGKRVTKVSGYDKFSAFLLSSIVVFGMLVLVGFVAWMNQFTWESRIASGDRTLEIGPTIYESEFKSELEIDDPDESMKSDSNADELSEAMTAITTVASKFAGAIDSYGRNAIGDGRKGQGDGHPGRPGGPPKDTLSEAQRWRVQYEAATRREYLKQLDNFGIELGALSKTTTRIDLVSNLSADDPTVSQTTRSVEKRLYFTHVLRRLRNWDTTTVGEAGIEDARSKIVVQFYTDDVREQLRAAESKFLKDQDRKLEEVRKTFFQVRENNGDFEFYVNRIEYRLLDSQDK